MHAPKINPHTHPHLQNIPPDDHNTPLHAHKTVHTIILLHAHLHILLQLHIQRYLRSGISPTPENILQKKLSQNTNLPRLYQN